MPVWKEAVTVLQSRQLCIEWLPATPRDIQWTVTANPWSVGNVRANSTPNSGTAARHRTIGLGRLDAETLRNFLYGRLAGRPASHTRIYKSVRTRSVFRASLVTREFIGLSFRRPRSQFHSTSARSADPWQWKVTWSKLHIRFPATWKPSRNIKQRSTS